jgi:hypothetical protein
MCVYVTMVALHEAESDEEEQEVRSKLVETLDQIEESSARISDADFGPGASLPAYLIEYAWMAGATAVAAIFLAAKLQRDLDDALTFANRLRRFVGRLRTLGYDPVLTFEGVCSVALHEIHDRNWAEDGIKIDHIVVSNDYIGQHAAYASLDELKLAEESEASNGLDPLSATRKYTFFGSSGARLFIVTVDNSGEVLIASQIS